MRKVLVMTLALLMVFAVAGVSTAENKIESAGNKLAEGIKDTATSPVRVPEEIVQTGKEQNPLAAVTLGPVRGAEETSRQATEGAIRTGFFLVPTPSEQTAQSKDLSIGGKLA